MRRQERVISPSHPSHPLLPALHPALPFLHTAAALITSLLVEKSISNPFKYLEINACVCVHACLCAFVRALPPQCLLVGG